MPSDLLTRYYYSKVAVPHGSGTYYASISDGGDVECANATYANAHDGTGTPTADEGAVDMKVGQETGFTVTQAFLEFDTTAIPAAATVSAATLYMTDSGDSSTTDFTIRVRTFDFGVSLTTADFVSGDDLSSTGTLVAHYDTSSGWAGAAEKTFTDDALAANITKAGTTRFVAYSSRQESETTPTGNEFIWIGNESGTKARMTLTW